MSTGFSGNLGYPLPSNWAFDQILEYSIGSGAGAIGIDKNIQSGADRGQTSVDSSLINSAFFNSLRWLESKAKQWEGSHADSKSVPVLITEALRLPTYQGTQWEVVVGKPDPAWLDFVSATATAENFVLTRTYLDIESGNTVDSAHLFATIGVYLVRGVPASRAEASNGDFGGWGGDLITAAADYHDHVDDYRDKEGRIRSAFDFGKFWIGGTQDENTFGATDLSQDVEGYNIAKAYRDSPAAGLAACVIAALQKVAGIRAPYASFYASRFGGDLAVARQAARRTLLGPFDPDGYLIDTGRAALWLDRGVNYADFTTSNLEGLADGFVDVLRQRAGLIA
jgi:peptidoglycan hydrolase-like protein with peptidoglycan-binding domain